MKLILILPKYNIIHLFIIGINNEINYTSMLINKYIDGYFIGSG